MKVKVKQKFREKYTGDIRFTGEIVEMSEKRYKEIERVYQIYTRKDEGRRTEKESRRNGS